MNKILKITLALCLSFTFFACSEDENKVETELSFNDTSKFLESVALIRTGVKTETNAKNSDEKYAFIINVVDFSESIDLHEAYMIDDLEYSDNGLYNDEVANDGVYTSVQKYRIVNQESNKTNVLNTQIINKSDNFKYEKNLTDYLNKNGIASKTTIKFGCKVRTVTCPETSWWNDCWFGSPCTCIEFYDCEASIEVEL
jgi:hypothetical protein